MPKLRADESIPVCGLCGLPQTFFLQIAFRENHPWAGLSLAVFACISCADESHLIPEMLSAGLRKVEIPDGFLSSYQRNFRFLVFETKTAVLRTDYRERVKFLRLDLIETDDATVNESKIGGTPNWILEDETPKSYGKAVPMFFLMQFLSDLQFPILAEAPPQMKLGLAGLPEPSRMRCYKLFLGNLTYLFGTISPSNPSVYAITQI